MWVIKFNEKYYWYGYNTVGKSLHRAVIYKTETMADDVAQDCLNRKKHIVGRTEELTTYRIVEVELKEKEV